MSKFIIIKNLRLLISIAYIFFVIYKIGDFETNPKYQGWGQLSAAVEVYFLSIGTMIILFSWIVHFLIERKRVYAAIFAILLLPCLVLQFGVGSPFVVIATFVLMCLFFSFFYFIHAKS